MTIPVSALCALYAAFVVKHLIADFLLQTGWMAIGKGQATDWVRPLTVHAGIHALATLAIVLAVRPSLWWLAIVDFVVHFAVDRGKALVTTALRLTDKDNPWWWLLGVDQALHQVTHFGFVLALLLAR